MICTADFEFSGRVEGGHFGRSVVPLGDLTGDRCGEFAVGAENSNYDGNVREGVVWIFRGAGHSSCPPNFGVYRLLQGDRNARFGSSLAAGQLDDDSVVDLAVGARTRSVEQSTRGSVSVYSGAVLKELPFYAIEDVWQNPPHQPELLGMVSGTAVNGEFGFSVAVAGRKLAVGAPNDQVGDLAPVGRVHLYSWSSTENSFAAHSEIVGETQRPGGRLGERLSGATKGGGEFLFGGSFGNANGLDNGSVYFWDGR